jgi:hypothetical protein
LLKIGKEKQKRDEDGNKEDKALNDTHEYDKNITPERNKDGSDKDLMKKVEIKKELGFNTEDDGGDKCRRRANTLDSGKDKKVDKKNVGFESVRKDQKEVLSSDDRRSKMELLGDAKENVNSKGVQQSEMKGENAKERKRFRVDADEEECDGNNNIHFVIENNDSKKIHTNSKNNYLHINKIIIHNEDDGVPSLDVDSFIYSPPQPLSSTSHPQSSRLVTLPHKITYSSPPIISSPPLTRVSSPTPIRTSPLSLIRQTPPLMDIADIGPQTSPHLLSPSFKLSSGTEKLLSTEPLSLTVPSFATIPSDSQILLPSPNSVANPPSLNNSESSQTPISQILPSLYPTLLGPLPDILPVVTPKRKTYRRKSFHL